MAVDVICPFCRKPVDPVGSNAFMNATTKEWQHRDCWTPRANPPPLPKEPRPSDLTHNGPG